MRGVELDARESRLADLSSREGELPDSVFDFASVIALGGANV